MRNSLNTCRYIPKQPRFGRAELHNVRLQLLQQPQHSAESNYIANDLDSARHWHNMRNHASNALRSSTHFAGA